MEVEEHVEDNEGSEIDDDSEDDFDDDEMDEMYEETRDLISCLNDYLICLRKMFNFVQLSKIPPGILQKMLPKGLTVQCCLEEIEFAQYDILDLNERLVELEEYIDQD